MARLVLIAAAVLFGASSSASPPEVDDEERAVVAVVLASLGPAESLVLETDAPAVGHPEDEAGRAEDGRPSLETKTIESFVARNRAGGRFDARVAPKLHLLTSIDKAALWDGVACERGWARLRAARPGATRLVSVSRVGVNHDHTQALVYMTDASNCRDARGRLYEVVKMRGAWVIAGVVPMAGP